MSIWAQETLQGYNVGKADTSFTKWRVLIMDRLAEIWSVDQEVAVRRLHQHGLYQLGIDFDNGVTAEDLAQKLAA